jgi:hypothetical protein
MICPHCNQPIDDQLLAKHLASKGGSSKSARKAESSRRNGRLGGKHKAPARNKTADGDRI